MNIAVKPESESTKLWTSRERDILELGPVVQYPPEDELNEDWAVLLEQIRRQGVDRFLGNVLFVLTNRRIICNPKSIAAILKLMLALYSTAWILNEEMRRSRRDTSIRFTPDEDGLDQKWSEARARKKK